MSLQRKNCAMTGRSTGQEHITDEYFNSGKYNEGVWG